MSGLKPLTKHILHLLIEGHLSRRYEVEPDSNMITFVVGNPFYKPGHTYKDLIYPP